jgi:NADH:ubiquinone reductase (H+-translocating)
MSEVLDHQAGQLSGEPLQPYTYRDFGSPVSVGKWSTFGNLMGFLFGRNVFVEGLFARVMYHSLRMMHERALSGTGRAALGVITRALAHRTAPSVKLH